MVWLMSSSGRRDFLAWLIAAPAIAGCAAETGDASTSSALPSSALPEPDHDDPDGELAAEGSGDYESSEHAATSCRVTTRDAEGPYFEPGAPIRTLKIAEANEPGVRLLVEGRLLGPDCRPLRSYKIDVWQADKDGTYYEGATDGFRLRGKIVSDAFGRYKFETVLPGRYADAAGIRPAHLHFKVLTPQNNTLLTSQLYFAGDPYLGNADYCTRSRTCNSADVARQLRLLDGVVAPNVQGKRARFDAILSRS